MKLKQWITRTSKALVARLVRQSTFNIDRYYYDVTDYDECLEECKKLDNGIMIGSVACQRCKYCVGFNSDFNWIKCKHIDKAVCV